MPSLLSLIWMAALALVVLAFAILAALIIARLHREREERANPDRRARVSKALVQFAMMGGEPPALAVRTAADRRMIIETALDAALVMPPPAPSRLAQLLRDIGMDDRLRDQARRGSVRDQMLAIEGLRLLPGEKTTRALLRSEQSRDLRIWLAALRVRTQLGAGPDMDVLLQLLERPGARRSPIMHELVATRALANLAEALQTLTGSLPAPTRAVLLRAIGETGEVHALGPLRVACLNPDPAVRSAAVGALGALGFEAAADALVRATRDADWRVRLKSAEAIGRLGLCRHADCLAPLLHDRVWWVRFRAEEALRRLADLGARRLHESAEANSAGESSALARTARR